MRRYDTGGFLVYGRSGLGQSAIGERSPELLRRAYAVIDDGGVDIEATDLIRVWHICGMTRTRLSTTVSKELLDSARAVRSGTTDAALIDEALEALLVRHRSAEVDASYAAAYEEHPIDEQDAWGDLASFRRAAAAS